MAQNFVLDTRQFERAIREVPDVVTRGAKTAMGDIKDDWLREARDLAPIDTGNLRRQLVGEVQGNTLDTLVVEMQGNATNGNFNVGYYIHEQDAGGKNLRTPGTVKKFFDVSAANREADWQRWFNDKIDNELRRARW